MSGTQGASLSEQIGSNLPFLRRYARALTGSQNSGDRYAAATLEAILADASHFDTTFSPKVALFRAFHAIWRSSGAIVDGEHSGEGIESKALAYLDKLTPNTREALLLHTVEEFTVPQVAQIMDAPEDEAAHLIDVAMNEMTEATSGRILIIEDEAIIAMDLETIVSELGHTAIGVARTVDGAVKLAEQGDFDLILSDIQLADGSNGIDAVNTILDKHGDRPVIFITAFPERLLTGDAPEPAFLISKPYTEAQVQSAVSQALFFASTETLVSG